MINIDNTVNNETAINLIMYHVYFALKAAGLFVALRLVWTGCTYNDICTYRQKKSRH